MSANMNHARRALAPLWGLAAAVLLVGATVVGSGCSDKSSFSECYSPLQQCSQECANVQAQRLAQWKDCRASCQQLSKREWSDCSTEFAGYGEQWADCAEDVMDDHTDCEEKCNKQHEDYTSVAGDCREDCIENYEDCMD